MRFHDFCPSFDCVVCPFLIDVHSILYILLINPPLIIHAVNITFFTLMLMSFGDQNFNVLYAINFFYNLYFFLFYLSPALKS